MLNELVTNISYLSDQLNTLALTLTSILGAIGTISLSISGGAAWLSAVLPVPKGPGLYYKSYSFINVFGGNVGNAANALKTEIK